MYSTQGRLYGVLTGAHYIPTLVKVRVRLKLVFPLFPDPHSQSMETYTISLSDLFRHRLILRK